MSDLPTLHREVKRGDLVRIASFLQFGADPDERDDESGFSHGKPPPIRDLPRLKCTPKVPLRQPPTGKRRFACGVATALLNSCA